MIAHMSAHGPSCHLLRVHKSSCYLSEADIQPISVVTSNGFICAAGAIASAMINATVPSMRCVALRLSGARLPLASVRTVVCATQVDSTGLSCTRRPSSSSRSK